MRISIEFRWRKVRLNVENRFFFFLSRVPSLNILKYRYDVSIFQNMYVIENKNFFSLKHCSNSESYLINFKIKI